MPQIIEKPWGLALCTNRSSGREFKGSNMVTFPSDFTVIDVETTGLEPSYCEIIEFAGIRVRDNKIVDTYSTLIKPFWRIDEFIEQLTGITNEMLETAPLPEEIIPKIRNFIGDDILLGHNVNFDVNFLYEAFMAALDVPASNDFIDTMRIARKALPELSHHRLSDIAEYLNISPNTYHRALSDCQTTLDCYYKLQDIIASSTGIDNFVQTFLAKKGNVDLRQIVAENTEFDETHPLYGKHCVFTGALDKMTRANAAQLVVNVGGICENNVTKKTNFLILGNNDYHKSIKDGKSSKQKKAEEYKLMGFDIEIIPENVFYEMIEA